MNDLKLHATQIISYQLTEAKVFHAHTMWVQRTDRELSHMVGNTNLQFSFNRVKGHVVDFKAKNIYIFLKKSRKIEQLNFKIKILIPHFQRKINTVFFSFQVGAQDEFHQFMNNSWAYVPVFLSYVEYDDQKLSRKNCSINYIQQDIIVECKPILWKFVIYNNFLL